MKAKQPQISTRNFMEMVQKSRNHVSAQSVQRAMNVRGCAITTIVCASYLKRLQHEF